MTKTQQISPEDANGIRVAPEQIQRIAQWFDSAFPTPSARTTQIQLGAHLEQVSAMLRTLHGASASNTTVEQLGFSADVLDFLQRQFKTGALELELDEIDRKVFLAALSNQVIALAGVAHMLGLDLFDSLETSINTRTGPDQHAVFARHRSKTIDTHNNGPDLTSSTTRRSSK